MFSMQNTSTNGPAVPFLGSYPKELKIYVYKKPLCKNFHSSFSHNIPKLETPKYS